MGNHPAPPVTEWPDGQQFDLAAYRQQLSYPQLVAPGRPGPRRGGGVAAGLAHLLRGHGRHRRPAR